MLSRFRTTSCRLFSRRGLCAPSVTPQVVTDIRDAIVGMKDKVGSIPIPSEIYTPETLDLALKSGIVDISLLTSTLSDFDGVAKKVPTHPSPSPLPRHPSCPALSPSNLF